jgi:hypothetical protein
MTRDRKYFLCTQIWIAALLALLIFSPYILWQIKAGLPALEYYQHYATGKTWPSTPAEFIKNQIVVLNPLAAPIWISGIYYFIFNRNGKQFRVIGYAYFIVLILCIYMQVKFYLPAPFYTVLFAGGAVCFEAFANRRHYVWLKRIPVAAIFLMGLVSVPFVRPILPIEVLLKVSGRGVYMGVKGERQRIGRTDSAGKR